MEIEGKRKFPFPSQETVRKVSVSPKFPMKQHGEISQFFAVSINGVQYFIPFWFICNLSKFLPMTYDFKGIIDELLCAGQEISQRDYR